MQSVANWITRAKWFLIFVLLIWGTFFLPVAYTECRAEGHNNVACGIASLFIAFFDVIVRVLVAVYRLFSWLLPDAGRAGQAVWAIAELQKSSGCEPRLRRI